MTRLCLLLLAASFAASGQAAPEPGSRGDAEDSRCDSCERDTHGRIRRSPRVKAEFQRAHPCPSTGKTAGPCPGYVADHRTALACADTLDLGIADLDTPENLQWQTVADGKAKDKWERRPEKCLDLWATRDGKRAEPPFDPTAARAPPTDEARMNEFAAVYNAYVNQLKAGKVDWKLWRGVLRAWDNLLK